MLEKIACKTGTLGAACLGCGARRYDERHDVEAGVVEQGKHGGVQQALRRVLQLRRRWMGGGTEVVDWGGGEGVDVGLGLELAGG